MFEAKISQQQLRLQADLLKRKLLVHFGQQWARKNAVGWLVFLAAQVLVPLLYTPSSFWFYLFFVLGLPSLVFGPVFSALLFLRLAFFGLPAGKPVVLVCPDDLDKLPRLRIRVFTRGLEAALVNRVMMHNVAVLKEIGFTNFDYFIVSNVTAVSVDTVPDVVTGNIFVPSHYQTETHVQYKARSLQYCVVDIGEGAAEQVNDDDYVLILDEDVQLTSNAARGVLNFMHGGHDVGDGCYSSLGDRWTLEDPGHHVPGVIFECHRTASYLASEFLKRSDIGYSFNAYGGFQLVKAKVARELTFDYGDTKGITEDLQLFLRALSNGYQVRHIEGFVRTQVPKDIQGMVDQRRRWAMGYLLHSSSEKGVKPEQRAFVATHFWASWIYPAVVFPLQLFFFPGLSQPLLWALVLSDMAAAACTLQIAVRTEGQSPREAFKYFWVSVYGTPLRYWYGIVVPTTSAVAGYLFNKNVGEWKCRAKG